MVRVIYYCKSVNRNKSYAPYFRLYAMALYCFSAVSLAYHELYIDSFILQKVFELKVTEIILSFN